MAVMDLLVPCLSVFAVSIADPTPVPDGAVEEGQPIVLAQVTNAEDLNAAQLQSELAEQTSEQTSEQTLKPTTAGMEAPYTAEIQPPSVETVEGDFVEYTTGPLVFADKSDEEIFTLVADYLQSVETMSANFIQTAPSGNVSTGTLQMSRPGRLRFEYDEPNPTLIVATQGLVYVHDADLETTDSYPVGKTPLKFLLSPEVKTDDAVLQEVLRAENSVNLILASTDEETEGRLIMTFAAPELKLVRWVIVDAAENYTIVDLDNVSEGVRIPNRTFRIPDSGLSFTRDR